MGCRRSCGLIIRLGWIDIDIGKLANRCKQCEYVDQCDNKRIEAFACLPDGMTTQSTDSIDDKLTMQGMPTLKIDLNDLKRQINKHYLGRSVATL